MDMEAQVQILNETVCISYNTNILGKGIHPTILPPAMHKIIGQSGFLTLVCQPV